jgi:methylated-DNA-protein-cysteine methyltransferase related protein
MPRSAAYLRIKTAVFAVVTAIPTGRVTSFRAIGDHLDVVPRHVAYILAMLSADEKEDIPWYRVVSDNGKVDQTRTNALGITQRELLEAEGVTFTTQGQICHYTRLFFSVDEASTGVSPVERDP